MRLNQYLASALNISRRQADTWIEKGLVEVNGNLGEFHNQIDESSQVRIFQKNEWQAIGRDKNSKSILVYKPLFCLTTKKDPQGRKTIYDVIPKIYHNLKPAGRLDYLSEGLLLMTSDGNLIHELTHPSSESDKVYLVGLHSPLSPTDIRRFASGMKLEDYDLNPVLVEPFNQGQQSKYSYLKLESKLIWYSFTLSEGRNNQIRKMCEVTGQKVQRLIRIRQGNFEMTPDLYRDKLLQVR